MYKRPILNIQGTCTYYILGICTVVNIFVCFSLFYLFVFYKTRYIVLFIHMHKYQIPFFFIYIFSRMYKALVLNV